MLIKQLKNSIEKGTAESIIPKELLDVFNDELPNGLTYKHCGSSLLAVDLEKTQNTIVVDEKENKAFLDKYKKYIKSSDDILRIACYTQTTIKVRNKKTIYNDTEIEQKFVFRDIFSGRSVNPLGYLKPLTLPEKNLKLSDEQDDNFFIDLCLKMQRCDNVEQCVYSNVAQNDVLNITITTPSVYSSKKNDKSSLKVTIIEKNAHNVNDVVTAYRVYVALINNRLLINGNRFEHKEYVSDKEIKETNFLLNWYQRLHELEYKFGIHFDPSVETKEEDLHYVNGLYSSIIDGKPFLDYASIKDITVTKKENQDVIAKNRDNNLFCFALNGKIDLTLFGQNITVYYIRIADKLKVVKYEPVDEENIKLVLENDNSKKEMICMLYQTKQELDNVISKADYVEYLMGLIE